MAKTSLLSFIMVLVLAGLSNAQAPQNKLLIDIPIRGKVSLPDGSPAKGATVEVVACGNERANLVRFVETDELGNFLILSFSANCSGYTFKASLKREMWLPTGLDAFYLQPNGTTPSLHLEPGKIPEPVVIRLSDQGGEVEFRVLDEATGSYLKAGISLMRITTKRPNIALVSFVIDSGNSGYVRLLPSGNYKVEVDRYFCAGKQIWLVKSVKRDFTVTTNKHQQLVVSLNTKTVKAKASYDNLNASSCTP